MAKHKRSDRSHKVDDMAPIPPPPPGKPPARTSLPPVQTAAPYDTQVAEDEEVTEVATPTARNTSVKKREGWLWSHALEQQWRKMLKERNFATRLVQPFVTLFGEGDTVHDATKFVKGLAGNPPLVKAAQWTDIFEKAILHKLEPEFNTRTINLYLRLIKTDNLFTSMWDSGQLRETHESAGWIAARLVFMKDKQIDIDNLEGEKTISPNPAQKKKQKTKETLYLRREATEKTRNSVNNALSDFHRTFVDLRLPAPRDGSKTAPAQAIDSLNIMVDFIFQNDANAKFMSWHHGTTRPWTKRDGKWESRETVKLFVENLYARTGNTIFTRVLLAHKKDFDSFNDDGTLIDEGIHMKPSAIQEKTIVSAGWLFGSHSTTNNKDLAEVLGGHSKVKGVMEIEIRLKEIRLRSGRQVKRKEFKDRQRAAHVMCGHSKAKECRSAMKRIFNEKGASLVLGKQLRFMPDALDPRFVPSPKKLLGLEYMAKAQHRFEAKMLTQGVESVQELDVPMSVYLVSLREVIMNFRSFANPEYALFVSVDTDRADPFRTNFVYHEDRQVEAQEVISKLPFLCLKLLGGNCHHWFTPSGWADTDNFTEDWATGFVTGIDEDEVDDYTEIAQSILHADMEAMDSVMAEDMGWKGAVDDEGRAKRIPLLKIEIDLDNIPKNQTGDNHTVGSNTLATFADISLHQQVEFAGHAMSMTTRTKAARPHQFATDPTALHDVEMPATTTDGTIVFPSAALSPLPEGSQAGSKDAMDSSE